MTTYRQARQALFAINSDAADALRNEMFDVLIQDNELSEDFMAKFVALCPSAAPHPKRGHNKSVIREQQAISYTKFLKLCERVQSKKNRHIIDYIIDAARINADDTLDEDAAATETQWDYFFRETIGSMLATGEYDRHVCGFFAKNGITW